MCSDKLLSKRSADDFSATWEKGGDSSDGYFTVDGSRVAVDVVTLKACAGTPPGLRFDKVAIRLLVRLQATLGEAVPDGMTVLLTVTAPIKMSSKTAGVLEDKIQELLGRGSRVRDLQDKIYGNDIQIRFLSKLSGQAPKMIGFVHNFESDPLLLLDMTSELLKRLGAGIGERTGLSHDRWLIVVSDGDASCLKAYRYIYSQLPMGDKTSDYQNVVMVFADGHVGVLAGETGAGSAVD